MKPGAELRKLLGALPRKAILKVERRHLTPVVCLLALGLLAGVFALTPSAVPRPDFDAMLRQRLGDRAQVDLFDDFHQGLDEWQGTRTGAHAWSYDQNGFVRVGGLSLFVPSLRLTDYDMDELAQIDSRGIGLVFRALSPHSFQALNLVLSGSGPVRSLAVQSYEVIAGHATRPVIKKYPERFPADTLFRVHLEVRGDAYALYVQGRLVYDDWTDPGLPAGGVGLFCSPGERARVAWIRVSHNTDFLGRACSLATSVLSSTAKF